MALSSGAVVSGYRIDRVLGAGGMGTVYLAADPVLPRKVALKVLSSEFSRDQAFRARFIKEADVAATLEHPNIVAVHSRGETEDGQLWIAMQYIAGTDASNEIKSGRMTPALAVHIVDEVAKALDYAHARGVVHRDVKPANFLLADSGDRILLADFGIARALDDGVSLTATGSIVGTIAYGAPETFHGQVDTRTDIYSLGCSLYQMLTGDTPFGKASNAPAMMAAHLSAPPPLVTDAIPTLPPSMNAVIARAMAKDPAQRFQSARELATAAQAALQGTPTGAWAVRPSPAPSGDPTTNAALTYPSGHFSGVHPGASPAPFPQGNPKPTRWWRRPQWIAVLVTAVLVVAAAGTTGLVMHRPKTAESPAIAEEPLMDVGSYSTEVRDTAQAKSGTAELGALFEAVRLAAWVAGPWELDETLRVFGLMLPRKLEQAKYAANMMKDAMPDITPETLSAHQYVTGFYTQRSATNRENTYRAVVADDLVMEFPDAEAASAAAEDLAAKIPTTDGARSLSIDAHPETTAVAYGSDEIIRSVSVGAHGAFVIFCAVNTTVPPGADPDSDVKSALRSVIGRQQSLLDGFTPTPVADLANLAKDPSGGLMGRTLTASNPTDDLPLSAGVFRQNGWLHFEPHPTEMAKVFKEAGVDWVSQLLATVYQAKRPDLATLVFNELVGQMTNAVRPVADGVPGLADTRCFERLKDWSKAGDALIAQQLNWHFKCFMQVDRYVFSTFSDTENDAKQQLTAQYRLLTGR